MSKEEIKTIRRNVGQRIDKFLNRWISRKLTVFLVASFGLFGGNLESNDWVIVASMYIAIQGATEIAEKLFKARFGN